MHYIIMSLAHLHGFHDMRYAHLDHLFYAEYQPEGETKFVKFFSEAKTWTTEQEAWNFTYDIWGMDFAQRNLAILCVRPEAVSYGY